MRFLVFGAGAVGSVVAARLAERHDVSLVAREEHARAIRERGLVITGRTERRVTNLVARSSVAELPPSPPSFVLVTTKAHQTAEAMAALEPFWSSSIFVSLQNGLGNEELMAERARRVLGAVINQGAILLEPGKVFHAGERLTEIGPFRETTLEDAEVVAEAFRTGGMAARAVTDVRGSMWRKLILNAAMNPLSALLKKKNAELLADPDLLAVMRDVVLESVLIARAQGVMLGEESVMMAIRETAAAAPENRTSMLQDLERGRRTEIDFINGALAGRARATGVPAPRNEMLTRLIHAAERAGFGSTARDPCPSPIVPDI